MRAAYISRQYTPVAPVFGARQILGIFISYRRDDAAGWAGRLTEHLRRRFPADKVFQDIVAIPGGADFVNVIQSALSSCKVALIMIGPNWLTAQQGGLTRLNDPNDFVRLEVALALQRPDVQVIPLLVGGARMPDQADLPDEIKPLARRNAFDLSDTRWDYDLERLSLELIKSVGIQPLRSWRSSALRKSVLVALITTAVTAGAWYWRSQRSDDEPVVVAPPPVGVSREPPFDKRGAVKKEDPPKGPGEKLISSAAVGPENPKIGPKGNKTSPLAFLPQPGSLLRHCDECPEMVVLPAGEFMMGSPRKDVDHNDNEAPRRLVKLTRPLAFGKYEVTRGQFAAFAKATGYDSRAYCNDNDGRGEFKLGWEDAALGQDDSHPVVCVDWSDAQAYAKWLSKKTGISYRLPSEAEWEYAARARSQTPFHWASTRDAAANAACAFENLMDRALAARAGDTHLGRVAKQDGVPCNDGHAYTSPVGKYKPNGFGLHDMAGNVSEWVIDCTSSYADAPENGAPVKPLPSDCGHRRFRGGSWMNDLTRARSAYRFGLNWDAASSSMGFRVALDL